MTIETIETPTPEVQEVLSQAAASPTVQRPARRPRFSDHTHQLEPASLEELKAHVREKHHVLTSLFSAPEHVLRSAHIREHGGASVAQPMPGSNLLGGEEGCRRPAEPRRSLVVDDESDIEWPIRSTFSVEIANVHDRIDELIVDLEERVHADPDLKGALHKLQEARGPVGSSVLAARQAETGVQRRIRELEAHQTLTGTMLAQHLRTFHKWTDGDFNQLEKVTGATGSRDDLQWAHTHLHEQERGDIVDPEGENETHVAVASHMNIKTLSQHLQVDHPNYTFPTSPDKNAVLQKMREAHERMHAQGHRVTNDTETVATNPTQSGHDDDPGATS